MKDKTNKYHLTFTYDNDIIVDTDCRDYWWDDFGNTFVVVSNTTNFYEKSRMSNLQERRLSGSLIASFY